MRFVDFSTRNALAVDTAANNACRGAEGYEGIWVIGYGIYGGVEIPDNWSTMCQCISL